MIRRLDASDLAAFKHLRLMSLELEPENYASTHAEWAAMSDHEWRHYLTGEPIFAAFEEEKPVALAGVIHQKRDRMAHRASVAMVFVVPERRGSGLADKMMDRVAGYARGCGLVQLELTVQAGNARAVRFYERLGFQRYGLLPRGFREPGGYVDDLLMVLALD
ncbi:MAG: GNAT family N-acetyltransferase [Boseongicola sp.]|nr:GNAT family N-acetyltransferase [Boseongicola sp.]